MNQIALKAEIHFHEQELLSIFHECNVVGKEEKFAELVFAAAFAIRSMSNLGPSAITDSLGQALQIMGPLVAEAPDELFSSRPKIIPYPGYAGRKRFISRLRITASRMKLRYSPRGFGWLGAGLGYYCPAAVVSLFHYLAHRRREDQLYCSSLGNVAVGCGQIQSGGHIRLTNHLQLVMLLVATCMEEFTPQWMSE